MRQKQRLNRAVAVVMGTFAIQASAWACIDPGTGIYIGDEPFLGKPDVRLFSYGAGDPYPSIALMGSDDPRKSGAKLTQHYYRNEEGDWKVKSPGSAGGQGVELSVPTGKVSAISAVVAPNSESGCLLQKGDELRIYQIKPGARGCASIEQTADFYLSVTALTLIPRTPGASKRHTMSVKLVRNTAKNPEALGELRADVIDGMRPRSIEKPEPKNHDLGKSGKFSAECGKIKQLVAPPTLNGRGGFSGGKTQGGK